MLYSVSSTYMVMDCWPSDAYGLKLPSWVAPNRVVAVSPLAGLISGRLICWMNGVRSKHLSGRVVSLPLDWMPWLSLKF